MNKILKLPPSIGNTKLGQIINKIVDVLNSGDIDSNTNGINLSIEYFKSIIPDNIIKLNYIIDEKNNISISILNMGDIAVYIDAFRKIKEHKIIVDKVRNKIVEDIDYSIYTIDENTYDILNPDESIYREAPKLFKETKIENNKYILPNQIGKVAYKNNWYYCTFTVEWNENNINELYFKFFTNYIDLYNDYTMENMKKFIESESEYESEKYFYYAILNIKELNEGLVCIKSYIDPNIEEFVESIEDLDLDDYTKLSEFYSTLNNEEKILFKSALMALITGEVPYKTDIIYDNVEENIKSMNNYFFYPIIL